MFRPPVAPLCALLVTLAAGATAASAQPPESAIVLHAARLLEVDSGRMLAPAEVLVEGEHIKAVGSSVEHPASARILDLGDTTLLPGLIDAHVHLFLHPGSEGSQTIEESVPERTLLAAAAAKEDLLAGFTAERDMGTEGAGSADTAVRDAINKGLIPGPRLRISGNAIDILGGHEDANRLNPEQHVLSNATYANTADELVAVIREQHKQGSDFVKIYETGPDSLRDGVFTTPYQYTAAQLKSAVDEAARLGTTVAVHGMGEPGTGYAAEAGVASIDHATQLSARTLQLMKEKHIPAVPTFTVFEYFAEHAATPAAAARERALLDYKVKEFRKQIAAGIAFAVGSDVGPFPHGTQARELELMVKYGMKPLAVLQADLINGAKLLGWEGEIGELKPGRYADIIAVPGNPLDDIAVVEHVAFVLKGGLVVREPVVLH
ncbi:MAG TPA: amidohydrolase family protein [Steroidobacteraceae bacterium]|jgi:imidazolonepropionase-like amidohydrolase|nr:amidohydrolase family protein [Steroidobacteraceae bacterium]